MPQIIGSSGQTPRIDFTLPVPPSISTDRFTVIDPRANANSFGDCFGFLAKIPRAIGLFFNHRWADARMCWRAFHSMGNGTSSNDINLRVANLRAFKTIVDTVANRNAVANHFNGVAMPLATRNLLYYVDQNYVDQYRHETDFDKIESIRSEIVREVDEAIAFQQNLRIVNTFYRVFSGRCFDNGGSGGGGGGGAAGVTEPAGPWPRNGGGAVTWAEPIFDPIAPDAQFENINDWIARILGRPRRSGAARTEPWGGAVSRPQVPLNLNVPGTVPYTPNNIPQAIRTKAAEIERLRERFAQLINPPALPSPVYNDAIHLEIMAMPVFDASHPQIQTAMNAAPSSSSASSVEINRDWRHYLDKDSMEGQLGTATSWRNAHCHICRHPTDGGMRRENMRIDTRLQDEILGFLRNAVNTAPASAFTAPAAATSSLARRT